MRTTVTIALGLALNAAALATPSFSFQVLGPVSGDQSSSAVGINNAGDVLVNSSSYPSPTRPLESYVWRANGSTVTVAPGGASSVSNAYEISNNYVVGVTNDFKAYRYNYTTGQTEYLGSAAAKIYGVNSQGDVVGIDGQRDRVNPVVWKAGTTTGTGFFAESSATSATPEAINDRGDVIGLDGPASDAHSYSWVATNYQTNGGFDTVYTDLTPASGGTSAQAYVLNDNGMAAGVTTYANGDQKTTVWTYGAGGVKSQTIYDTGKAYYAFTPTGINDEGDIVGSYYQRDPDNAEWAHTSIDKAFLYENGQVYNMASLMASITPGYAGYTPVNAWGVNDKGQVVGTLSDGFGHYVGYVATPVPEPGTLAALGLGAAAFLRRRRKAAQA